MNYHVAYDDEAALWTITEEGAESPIAQLVTQEEAVGYARGLRTERGGGGQIKVHKLDGTFSDLSE